VAEAITINVTVAIGIRRENSRIVMTVSHDHFF
jgi:hypothetical protein